MGEYHHKMTNYNPRKLLKFIEHIRKRGRIVCNSTVHILGWRVKNIMKRSLVQGK
jgi:metal-dependent HD superfamily phosphatase/phosphodiesterase